MIVVVDDVGEVFIVMVASLLTRAVVIVVL